MQKSCGSAILYGRFFVNRIGRELQPGIRKMCTDYGMKDNINFEKIEGFLSKFGGGKVSITKEYWDEGIALLNISHPEKKNAISGKMMVELRKCVGELEKWDQGKAVLVCSREDSFCSGGDLDYARATANPEGGFCMSSVVQDALSRLKKLPIVSFAVANGPTLGGGAEITLFSDFLLVTENVRYGFVHGRMGISTPWGSNTRLVELLGERKALDLLLTSRIMNAQECVQIGLASAIVDTEKRIEQAVDFIRPRIQHPTPIVRTFKTVARNAVADSFENSLAFERKLFCPFWGGKYNKEALQKRIKHINRNSNL